MDLARSSKNPLRKLYFWTLHWADTKVAIPVLFFLSFIESSFFPIPPDVLLMAICFAKPKKWLQAAVWCTVGSVLGGVFGWYIGWGLWEVVGQPIVAFYHGEAIMEHVKELYTTHGFWGILVAAITPIPYKVFTIASGIFQFSLPLLIVASIVGRGFRFFLVAGLIRVLGEKVREFHREAPRTLSYCRHDSRYRRIRCAQIPPLMDDGNGGGALPPPLKTISAKNR